MFDPDEIRRIEETLAAATDGSDGLAYAFYEKLFAALPEARQVFRGDLANHVPRFMGMLHAIPLAVELPDEMRAALREIGAEHFRLGVRVEHYGPMMQAVFDALAATSGAAWTDAAAAAWGRFLQFVRLEMIAGRPAPGETGTTPSAG